VRGKGRVDGIDVWVVEAGARNSGFEVVQADDLRHSAEVAKRALVQPNEGLELLIPDRLLVAVP
jgi:hypothetical protein